MGNSRSAIQYEESAAVTQLRTCRSEHCANAVIFIDGRTTEEPCSDCQSSDIQNQKDNVDWELFQTLSALNSSISSRLSQEIARSPLAITQSNTHAESDRFHQGDGSEFSKKAAELQLYIVTWNMKGQVRI